MGLIVVIVGAVVALVLVLLLRDGDKSSSGQTTPAGGSSSSGDFGGDSTGSAKALGQKAVDVIQNHAMEEAEKLVCKPDSKFLRSMRGLEGTKLTVTLNDVTESGDTAVAAVTMVRDEDKKSVDQKINMKQADGKWCIN
ncbi:hypothetical protein [Actinocrispum sp. NPDC049592]|uniref:hypothetical protein n=1 Tax=Actinocrispum sp. NPDC049592 TaxID=3154835 RepID=UPI00341DED7B